MNRLFGSYIFPVTICNVTAAAAAVTGSIVGEYDRVLVEGLLSSADARAARCSLLCIQLLFSSHTQAYQRNSNKVKKNASSSSAETKEEVGLIVFYFCFILFFIFYFVFIFYCALRALSPTFTRSALSCGSLKLPCVATTPCGQIRGANIYTKSSLGAFQTAFRRSTVEFVGSLRGEATVSSSLLPLVICPLWLFWF